MLNKLRNFSKGKMATVLVAIIIVPFVFLGMGSVFSGGSTNSVAKLNNYNISTKDFVEFINKSKINPELIRDNIDNNNPNNGPYNPQMTSFVIASGKAKASTPGDIYKMLERARYFLPEFK